MDAAIGRYKAHIEGTDLILTHELGISFDLTVDETLALFDFINVYRQTLITTRRDTLHDTEPRLERVFIEEQDGLDD